MGNYVDAFCSQLDHLACPQANIDLLKLKSLVASCSYSLSTILIMVTEWQTPPRRRCHPARIWREGTSRPQAHTVPRVPGIQRYVLRSTTPGYRVLATPRHRPSRFPGSARDVPLTYLPYSQLSCQRCRHVGIHPPPSRQVRRERCPRCLQGLPSPGPLRLSSYPNVCDPLHLWPREGRSCRSSRSLCVTEIPWHNPSSPTRFRHAVPTVGVVHGCRGPENAGNRQRAS